MEHSPRLPTALVVRSTDDREFTTVLEWLHQQSDEAVLSLRVGDRSTWCVEPEHPAPDLLVVLQSWPDEWMAPQVTELLGSWPLTRVVCCTGRWCLSDGRTRLAWPWACRVPVEEALPRLRTELLTVQGARPVLPVTASREEFFSYAFGRIAVVSEVPTSLRTAHVVSLDRVYGETVVHMFGHWGLSVAWSPGLNSVPDTDGDQLDLLVVDVDGFADGDLFHMVQWMRERFPAIRVLAISDEITPDLRLRLSRHTISAILPRLASSTAWLDAINAQSSDRLRERVEP